MSTEPATLEEQIERVWLQLHDHFGRRRVFLTPGGTLRHGEAPRGEAVVDVGYFTRAITLADFREAVFAAYGELKGRVHAR